MSACASAAPAANSEPPTTKAVAAIALTRRRSTAAGYGLGRREDGGVGADPLAGVEAGERRHVVLAQLEVEDLDVLADPLRRHRLRDRDVAELQMPAQDRLRRG